MKRVGSAILFVMFLGLVSLYARARLRSELAGAEVFGPTRTRPPSSHIVTKKMADSSRSMLERTAASFETVDADGRFYKLSELCGRGPVVLTFVKNGCPCSEAAQPFFNQVQAAYPGAGFFGVIEAASDTATRWATRFHVTYPLLLDPDSRIIRDYGVENSAYVVLVDRQGRIRKHWPGYSVGMLRELGATLAELTGCPEHPLDVSDAPDEEYSGCPFDL